MIVASFLSQLFSLIRFCYYAFLYIIALPWKIVTERHAVSISSSPPHPSLFSSLQKQTEKKYRIKSIMLSSPLELTLIKMFASSIKAKNALDIGCFTGYSALYLFFSVFSRSSPPSVLTIDNDSGRIAEAEKFFRQIDPKKEVIKTVVGDAFTIMKRFETEEYAKELQWNHLMMNRETEKHEDDHHPPQTSSIDDERDYSIDFYQFVGSNGQPPFDLIYLDADKVHYPLYYQLLLDKHYLSPHGLLFFDNVLLFTAFVAPWPKMFGGNAAEGVTELNKLISDDKRVEALVLPFRDGLAVIKWSAMHLTSCSICKKRSIVHQHQQYAADHQSINGVVDRKRGHSTRALNGGMTSKKSSRMDEQYEMDSLSLNGDMIPFALRSERYAAVDSSNNDRMNGSSSSNARVVNGRSTARGSRME